MSNYTVIGHGLYLPPPRLFTCFLFSIRDVYLYGYQQSDGRKCLSRTLETVDNRQRKRFCGTYSYFIKISLQMMMILARVMISRIICNRFCDNFLCSPNFFPFFEMS